MNAILIKADKKINKKLYKLAKELGGDVYSLEAEQFEDFALGILMDKNKTNELVTKEEVMKKLNGLKK